MSLLQRIFVLCYFALVGPSETSSEFCAATGIRRGIEIARTRLPKGYGWCKLIGPNYVLPCRVAYAISGRYCCKSISQGIDRTTSFWGRAQQPRNVVPKTCDLMLICVCLLMNVKISMPSKSLSQAKRQSSILKPAKHLVTLTPW